MDGVQIAGLSNYTHGQLTGTQLALINRAGIIEGKNSYEPAPTGFQIGLFNKADRMNGFQIGLVNVGKTMQGTQIGLVNIYKGGTDPLRKDGTPIGLINIGGFTYGAVYANELFLYNYELSTGNRKNGRILQTHENVYLTNSVIYSSHGYRTSNNNEWALGYGFTKMRFNRSERPFENEKQFMAYGVDVMHLNSQAGVFTKDFNMLTRFKYLRGVRIMRRVKNLNMLFPFFMVSANVYAGNINDQSVTPSGFKSKLSNKQLSVWPGFALGMLIH
jgi:hypothetical protein